MWHRHRHQQKDKHLGIPKPHRLQSATKWLSKSQLTCTLIRGKFTIKSAYIKLSEIPNRHPMGATRGVEEKYQA